MDLSIAPSDAAVARLSAMETARAARFAFAADRTRYLAAHVALRALLKRHCGAPARREIFVRDDFGKWRLAGPSPWHFTLSYAGQLAVIGIGRDRPIGIDIEVDRAIDDATGLAQLCFDARERAALDRAGPTDCNAAFLRGWTRKEACLKAIGTGLGARPADFHSGLTGISTVAIGEQAVAVGSFRLGNIIGAWAQVQ